MEGDLEESGAVQLAVAAALSQEYAQDLQAFIPFLADLLERALPGETEILQKGFFKKEMVGVAITLGNNRYKFELAGRNGVAAARTHIVRGIALKTEEVAMEEALQELSIALDERLQKNTKARSALAGMLGL